MSIHPWPLEWPKHEQEPEGWCPWKLGPFHPRIQWMKEFPLLWSCQNWTGKVKLLSAWKQCNNLLEITPTCHRKDDSQFIFYINCLPLIQTQHKSPRLPSPIDRYKLQVSGILTCFLNLRKWRLSFISQHLKQRFFPNKTSLFLKCQFWSNCMLLFLILFW